jgi:tetratricopeptide (TPR) repeat protein
MSQYVRVFSATVCLVAMVGCATNHKAAYKGQAPEVPQQLLAPRPAARPEILVLQELQRELTTLEKSDNKMPADLALQVEAFLNSGLDTTQRMQAALLLVAVYDKQGEKDKALDAFGDCLDVTEEIRGEERAVSLAQSRAGDILIKDSDKVHGHAYYDLIRKRYPASPAAGYASIKIAACFNQAGRSDLAIEELREFTTKSTNNPWFYTGVLALSENLFNTGHREEACSTLQQVCKSEDMPDGIAALLAYRMASYHSLMGPDHTAVALDGFQQIIENHADSEFAPRAKKRIEKLKKN